jgi:hypothetical protein
MIPKYIFRSSGQAGFSTPRRTFHGNQRSVFGLTHRPVSDSVNRNTSSRTEVKNIPAKILRNYKNVASHGQTKFDLPQRKCARFRYGHDEESKNLTTDSTPVQTAIWPGLCQSQVSTISSDQFGTLSKSQVPDSLEAPHWALLESPEYSDELRTDSTDTSMKWQWPPRMLYILEPVKFMVRQIWKHTEFSFHQRRTRP